MDYMNLSAITWIFERLKEVLMIRSQSKRDLSKEEREAYMEFQRTIIETRLYNSLRKNDRRREEELSRLWSEVSMRLRPFDSELADRCFKKSRAWADGDNWINEDHANAQILLCDMEASLENFLNRKKQK